MRLNSLALALTVAGRGQLGERLLSGWKVSALLCSQARQVHSHCRLLDLTRSGQVNSLGWLMTRCASTSCLPGGCLLPSAMSAQKAHFAEMFSVQCTSQGATNFAPTQMW